VNQRGGLESLAGPFALHIGAGHAAEFGVDQGD
jgi:hypothetical protein